MLRTCVCLGATKEKKDLEKFNMLSPLIWQYAFFSFGKLGGEVLSQIVFFFKSSSFHFVNFLKRDFYFNMFATYGQACVFTSCKMKVFLVS